VSKSPKKAEKKARKKAEKAEKKARKAEKKKLRVPGEKIAKVAHTAGLLTGTFSEAQNGQPEGDLVPTRDLFGSMLERRSHKKFKDTPIDRTRIQTLLEAAVLAPNHKLTEPWGFVVMGERAKRAYGETKARIKVGSEAELDGSSKAQKIVDEIVAVPAVLAVTQRLDSDPHRREEDYAAVFMAIQNLLLAATALGLGTKIHTGSILEDGWLREALGVSNKDRIVALIDVGEPEDELPPAKRTAASEKTRWLD
jgi:nitroreductase